MTPPTPLTATWTVPAHPRRITPVTITLIIGAITNVAAVATLTTILLDGPLWLVITSTASTALLALTAPHFIRAIDRAPQTASPTTPSGR